MKHTIIIYTAEFSVDKTVMEAMEMARWIGINAPTADMSCVDESIAFTFDTEHELVHFKLAFSDQVIASLEALALREARLQENLKFRAMAIEAENKRQEALKQSMVELVEHIMPKSNRA